MQREENLSPPGGGKGICKRCKETFSRSSYKFYKKSSLSHSPYPHKCMDNWPGLTRMQYRPWCVALTRRKTNISFLQLSSPLNLHEILPLESHFFCFKALYLQKFLMKNETFPWLTYKVISSPSHNWVILKSNKISMVHEQ